MHTKSHGSVRLSGDPLESLAGIDEIINRSDHEAFARLLHAIIEHPDGPVADGVRVLYERVQHRAADPEFAAWPQYQAAYWLAVAMGQFRPADTASQRFASVLDAIEDDHAEAEKNRMIAEMPPPIAQQFVPTDPVILHTLYTLADYPVLVALAAERTQATRLDGRACRAIYEDARSRIDWRAMPPNERDFAQRLGIAP